MARERKPTHPGEVLYEDVMKPLGLTVTEAARKLRVARKTLSELVNRRAGMSTEMALRVARATNTSAESWLNMQLTLDLWEARRREPRIAAAFAHT
jgi:addiction module HigA family antidote